MIHFLTDKEIKKIIDDLESEKPIYIPKPKYPPFLVGAYVSSKKIDIYSFYLMDQFAYIDDKYRLESQIDLNKGAKGELLMCAIIDLTMWSFGYRLSQDYTVDHDYTPGGENTIDFKLTCLDNVFLCEAKNWAETTWVGKKTYFSCIKTRFFCDGINILMILRNKNKIPAIEKMYSKYSTDNGQPINYLQISNFMGVKWNDIYYVNGNLMLGVNQMLNFVLRTQGRSFYKEEKIIDPIEIDRDYSLTECLQMGMPNWFIIKYLDYGVKTVNREAKRLGLNRKSSYYKSLTKYRDIKRY